MTLLPSPKPPQAIHRPHMRSARWPPGHLPWGPSLAPSGQPRYNRLCRDRSGVRHVRDIKRRVLWTFVLIPILTGCQPLNDLGKLADDLLRRFTG
jgi:hypothetical protein